jgi:hypothetical protein
MEFLMEFPKPRLVILLCMTGVFLLVIGLCAYAAITLWREAADTPDDPVPMRLQEAVEQSKTDDLWVALQNTEGLWWDCSTIYFYSVKETDSEWMDIVVTDPTESIILVVSLKDTLTCDQLRESQPALSGELSHLSKRDFDELDTDGRLSHYPQTASFLKLCTFCNPNESSAMIGVSLFCLAGSVIMMLFVLREVPRTWNVIRELNARHLVPDVQPGTVTDEELMAAFFFTPSDLATNMAGFLTPRQKAEILPRKHQFVKSLLLLLIMGLGIIVYSISGLESDPDLNTKYAILGAFFIALVILAALLDLYGIWRIRRGKASMVYGPVSLKIKTVGEAVEYRATIEGKTFFLNPGQYALLIEGRVYYFYYAPVFGYRGRKKLLSVRRI